MLLLTFRGQLGNQMFQYAAMRSIAESRGLELAWREGISIKDKLRRALGRPVSSRRVMLNRFFRLDGDGTVQNIIKLARYHLLESNKRIYRGKYCEFAPNAFGEKYDPFLCDIVDGAEVKAWLQSPEYFSTNSSSVIRWFTPKTKYIKRIDEIDRSLPVKADQRCCIHIRRTDYAQADPAWGTEENGWILPLSYYHNAISELPRNLFYVIISDDPIWVKGNIDFISPSYISENESAVVDMFLMTRCRYNVIANSTFSWWGAWLNQDPKKIVIAPQYFNGWKNEVWHPERIKVHGWKYISVF